MLTNKDGNKISSDSKDELHRLAVDVLKHLEAWLKQQATSYDQRIDGISNVLLEFEKVYDNKNAKKEIIEIVLTKSPDKPFNKWNEKALEVLIQMLNDDLYDGLGSLTLDSISLPETSKARREALLDLLVGHFVPNGLSAHNADKIFKLLWHNQDEIREIGRAHV